MHVIHASFPKIKLNQQASGLFQKFTRWPSWPSWPLFSLAPSCGRHGLRMTVFLQAAFMASVYLIVHGFCFLLPPHVAFMASE